MAAISIAQNFITYAQTGKLDGWQLFFDALDMLPLLSFAGARAAKAAGGWNCFIAGTPVLAAAGVMAGEHLVAEALPAEYKTWNVPVLLGSGALIFLGAVQVARVLQKKRLNEETRESDLIIVKRRLLLPDSQFGWI